MEKEEQCRDQGLLYLENEQLMAQLGFPSLLKTAFTVIGDLGTTVG